jgi:hypothetical protein
MRSVRDASWGMALHVKLFLLIDSPAWLTRSSFGAPVPRRCWSRSHFQMTIEMEKKSQSCGTAVGPLRGPTTHSGVLLIPVKSQTCLTILIFGANHIWFISCTLLFKFWRHKLTQWEKLELWPDLAFDQVTRSGRKSISDVSWDEMNSKKQTPSKSVEKCKV